MNVPAPSDTTALIVLIPEAESLVGPYRTRYDPVAPLGMPAHVTLMFPFLDCEALTAPSRDQLRAALAELPTFDYEFRSTGAFPGVLYMRPEDQNPFVEAISVVRKLFPQLEPYGDRMLAPVPHLTVAHASSEAVLEEIRESFESELAKHGPVSGTAVAATLMRHTGTLWESADSFPFRGRLAS
jgi:2'-5' RNA ligase